jgi:predicted neuraminidase
MSEHMLVIIEKTSVVRFLYRCLALIALAVSFSVQGDEVAFWSFDGGSDADTASGLIPLSHEDSEVLVFTNDYLQLKNQGKDYASGEALMFADSPVFTGHADGGTGYTSLVLEADILLDETGEYMQIIRKTDGDLGYQLFVQPDETITFRITTELTTLHLNSKNSISADGQWHHVEAVWDAGVGTYTAHLVVDGVVSMAAPQLGALADTGAPLTIGGLYRTEGNTGQLFRGGIDNLRISVDRPELFDISGEIYPLPDEMTGGHLSWQPGLLSTRFVFDTMVTPECHAATLAQRSDGAIVAAWFGGTHEGHVDVGVWQSVFDGQSWAWPLEVGHGYFLDGTPSSTFNPVLFQYPDSDVMLLFYLGGELESSHGTLQVSRDGAMTWSEPWLLSDSVSSGAMKNKPVLLDDGTLIYPSSSGGRLKFLSTSDFGETWSQTSLTPAGEFEGLQPTILVHTNGALQALARSQSGSILTSWSTDQGNTWSVLEKTSLPNNNSGIDAVTLSDGRFLLVYNHVGIPDGYWGGPRTPLNVAVSEDGIHWSAAVELEDEDGEFSYPAVIQAADGTVHVLYTWNRLRIKHVTLDPAAFDLEPIVDGEWPEQTGGFLFVIE